MTSFDRFERSLPALFDELATPRIPDYYDDVMARTAATRQRPGWTFPERWLPMSTLTQRLAAAPRIPWRLGVLVALLVVAGLIAAIVAGELSNRRPAPFGPAANGQILFIDPAGRVAVGDPGTGDSKVLVAGSGHVGTPLFSLDGSRIAYAQEAAGGRLNIFAARADGSQPILLTQEPIGHPQYVGWSAQGDRFLVVTEGGALLLFNTARTEAPTNLSKLLNVRGVSVGLGYNYRSDAAFRPPAGTEILFVTGERTLQAAKPDGTALRTLLTTDSPGIELTRLTGAHWSPDGSQVLVLVEFPGSPDRWHPYIVRADGTGLRPLWAGAADPLIGVNSALWSPDGTRVAFQYWRHHPDGEGQDFNPIGIVDVASGQLRDVGRTFPNGYVSWQWSPDGTSIIQVPGDDSGDILIVNATTGVVTSAPWQASQGIDWQRVAP